jgi:hypothetical protein
MLPDYKDNILLLSQRHLSNKILKNEEQKEFPAIFSVIIFNL